MKLNPFTSKTYQEIWLKHFSDNPNPKQFPFIKDLLFFKHRFLPYYINSGRNMTNGVTYEIDSNVDNLEGKTQVIYDVPDYCETNEKLEKKNLKIWKVRQYKGFLADLSGFSSFEDYFQNTLHSKSRNKFRSTLKKFESCFDVKYVYYYGPISMEVYESMMANFKDLVESRYSNLKIDTTLINEWPFYHELVFQMLQEKKALIVSIEVSGKPISMSLAFLGENTLVGAVKAFNTDYYKFNVGHIEISKFIEWCFDYDMDVLDFSKGEYEYKTKWTNTEYVYNCHVLCDSSSMTSRTTGNLLVKYFELKQYLRDKNFNLFVAKTRFKIKNLGSKKENVLPFKILKVDTDFDVNQFELVSLNAEIKNYPFLKRLVLDGLYQKPEAFSGLKVYKSVENQSEKPKYAITGIKQKYLIQIL
ncbi:GNAT family N-acetyltransferase [Bizionia myxarmorum]|uniref:GNAT family N-acetyltransferase n=1 Tax=Bizionia myxarmorum TaxID=291186 RepID=A0A5D0R3T8_9FLAO|nr:GNAT family N-acetyltransferase [Bizionia myxarmorum]TYB76227.1 GNAT family N-acetyltransferase [Bizionia myxarmorum]